jgi:hypothetical protein
MDGFDGMEHLQGMIAGPGFDSLHVHARYNLVTEGRRDEI